MREGDYGNSAFLILSGCLRVVLSPGLPRAMLGRQTTRRKGPLEALSQLWTQRRIPEVRDPNRYTQLKLKRGQDAQSTRVGLQDLPVVLDQYQTALLTEGMLFGELAALGRGPRTATVFAETPAQLLEIRWRGLRELRHDDAGWRRKIDERYRENALKVHLGESPLFLGLDPKVLQQVADQTLFETYGSFDWNVSYKRLRAQGQESAQQEPIIAEEGNYPDGLLMVRAGVRAGLGPVRQRPADADLSHQRRQLRPGGALRRLIEEAAGPPAGLPLGRRLRGSLAGAHPCFGGGRLPAHPAARGTADRGP